MTSIFASLLALFGVSMTQANENAIVTQHENVWIAAQPSEADLDAWAAAGAKVVVNSRTPEETAGLPFDYRAAVEARGMRYVDMPIGGASGANPQHTLDLNAILADSDGPAVMHCRSGMRSAHLYAAHLQSTGAVEGDAFDAMSWPGPRDANMVDMLTPAAND